MTWLGFVSVRASLLLILSFQVYTLAEFAKKLFDSTDDSLEYNDFYILITVIGGIIFSIIQLCYALQYNILIPLNKIIITPACRHIAVITWICSATTALVYSVQKNNYIKPSLVKVFNVFIFSFLVVAISTYCYEIINKPITTVTSENYLLIFSFFNINGTPIGYSLILFILACYSLGAIVLHTILSNLYERNRKVDKYYYGFLLWYIILLGLKFNCFNMNIPNNINDVEAVKIVYLWSFGIIYTIVNCLLYYNIGKLIKNEGERC